MCDNQTSSSSVPIFVMGSPRAGTTLTARIMGRHHNVFAPGETHYFEDIYSRRKSLGDAQSGPDMTRVLERLGNIYARFNEHQDQKRVDRLFSSEEVVNSFQSCRTYKEILDRFMQLQMREENKERWLSHVPRDIFNIDDIVGFYEDAKIIVCIRDLRDFLASYKKKWKATTPDNAERIKKLYHPIITTLLWRSSIRQIDEIKKKVSIDDLKIIKYEDLVRHPLDVVKGVCEFIGEDFEPEMLRVNGHNSSHKIGESSDGIFSSSVGVWRTDAQAEEVYVAQLLAGKELMGNDYEIVDVDIDKKKLLRLYVSLPIALYKALCANKDHHGPFVPYVTRRLKSMF